MAIADMDWSIIKVSGEAERSDELGDEWEDEGATGRDTLRDLNNFVIANATLQAKHDRPSTSLRSCGLAAINIL
jgi:hypothetical protein